MEQEVLQLIHEATGPRFIDRPVKTGKEKILWEKAEVKALRRAYLLSKNLQEFFDNFIEKYPGAVRRTNNAYLCKLQEVVGMDKESGSVVYRELRERVNADVRAAYVPKVRSIQKRSASGKAAVSQAPVAVEKHETSQAHDENLEGWEHALRLLKDGRVNEEGLIRFLNVENDARTKTILKMIQVEALSVQDGIKHLQRHRSR